MYLLQCLFKSFGDILFCAVFLLLSVYSRYSRFILSQIYKLHVFSFRSWLAFSFPIKVEDFNFDGIQYISFLIFCAFCILSKESLPNPTSQMCFPVFIPPKVLFLTFIVHFMLAFIFMLVFMYSVR